MKPSIMRWSESKSVINGQDWQDAHSSPSIEIKEELVMRYDFSKPETQKIFQQEVSKRMAPPLNMSRTQAEMLVATLMWSPYKDQSEDQGPFRPTG